MYENINLIKILEFCPKGTKLYSTIYGEVEFYSFEKGYEYPIRFMDIKGNICYVTENGKHDNNFDGECTLFPSKDQRDWNKFSAPWLKKEKFDPKTLQAFDKVIVRDATYKNWKCDFFSYMFESATHCPYRCVGDFYMFCIPYNDETKHLVGTTEEAPEFYRYWED